MERSDWLTTDGLSYPAWMLVSAAHAVVTEGHSKRSACFSERSELVGDSNFPDNSSDLSDGQIWTSGQGVCFTGMFPHAGMTKKARRLAD
ncbi:hypothetical protein [Paraglaciecola chathamensis]|uniref:hypothetical protein n=1 Tax=Paraglaciecola chathamensis TaxID=368405 RepID=UPI00209131B7|nr:hypothetical protein [Paraglaciecola agarilytica]